MLKRIKKILHQLSYCGVKTSMPEEFRSKIIMCNRAGIIGFIVLLKSQILYLGAPILFTLSTFIGLVYLSLMFWNWLGLHNLSRAIMVFFPTAILVVLAGLMTEGPSVSSRSLVMANILCPLLLYRISEPVKMAAGIAWNIGLYILYDPITSAIPRHFEVLSDRQFDYPLNTTITGTMVLLMISLIFIIMQNMHVMQENILRLQVKRGREQLQKEKKRIDELTEKLSLSQIKQDNFEELNKSLQGQALRAQMDPHFIFNALNSIQNFILIRDTNAAMGYVSRFSKLMRQTLESSMKEKVTVEEELDMLRNYLDLEQLRFDKLFEYRFEIDEQIDVANTEIPSMLLQPYIENAILHGLRHRQGVGGLLKITMLHQFEHLLCVIEDNGIGRRKSEVINKERQKHRSAGTNVTKTRLSLLQLNKDNAAQVVFLDIKNELGEPAGTRVEIKLPNEF